MDCRTFHQKLEDYLQDGLDFSGRFGMERHAQQCISCGKEMADAQQLRRMVLELQRVKAPGNFESSLLREIATHKTHGRFWSIRKYWIYGYEWPSWRKMAYASSCLVVLALGAFYAFHQPAVDHVSAPEVITSESSKPSLEVKEAKANIAPNEEALVSKKPSTVESPKLGEHIHQNLSSAEQESRLAQDVQDMDYGEYLLTGPDNYAVPVRLPRKIPMHYSQMSEEYFIQNVSH
jgi:hypothetical protein